MTGISNYVLPFAIPYKEYFLPVILQISYIILASKKKLNKSKLFKFTVILFPLLLLYLFELIRYQYLPGRSLLSIYIHFITIISFVIFFAINYTECHDYFRKSIRAYWIFNYFIAVIACITYMMLMIGIVELDNWGLPNYFGENFRIKNQYQGYDVYSVPFHISVIMKEYVKPLGILSKYGTFTGLSYEPHIANFFMTPAFIITFSYYKLSVKNLLKFIPFVVFFLLSFSLANIIGLLTILTCYLLFFKIDQFKIKLVSIITIILLSIMFFFQDELYLLYKLYVNYSSIKMESRSGDETILFIKYILNPNSIIGYGSFNIPTHRNSYLYTDIGFISSILLIINYVLFILITIYNYLKGRKIKTLIGIYFIVHSLKFPMHVILYPYTVFILFMIYDEKVKFTK